MSSIIKRPNNRKWLQFKAGGKRRTLCMGRVNTAQARSIQYHVDTILASKAIGAPIPIGTVDWLTTVDPVIKDRLAAAGVTDLSTHSLDGLLEYCLGEYEASKPNTLRNMKRTADWLREFFDDRPLHSITAGDAADFRRFLIKSKQAETTTTSICRKARRFFTMGVEKKWITSNPFSGMKNWVHTNEKRLCFVERETIQAVIDACEPEWQLILALARYGGLRCPSEIIELRWEWVNLGTNRFTIFSPKNEKYRSKAYRSCPIFPELQEHFLAAWDRAATGDEFVIKGYRDRTTAAVYNGAIQRLARANVPPWPKLFVNLRASRETELVEEFPIHVVTAWLGNSPTIAQAHYLQVTDDHFERAVKSQAKSQARAPEMAEISPEKPK